MTLLQQWSNIGSVHRVTGESRQKQPLANAVFVLSQTLDDGQA